MHILKTVLLITSFFLFDGIYDFQLADIDGNTINLSDFQGKKILIVNTATDSDYAGQYGSLEQLYQKYNDSLVIIAIPSNSFGNESGSNDSIKSYVMNNYNIHYILTSKMNVIGDSIAPVYQWLANNGQLVNQDFFKFLISGQGNIIGVYDKTIDPMNPIIQDMIANH
jgi:glutathione peroxidase